MKKYNKAGPNKTRLYQTIAKCTRRCKRPGGQDTTQLNIYQCYDCIMSIYMYYITR